GILVMQDGTLAIPWLRACEAWDFSARVPYDKSDSICTIEMERFLVAKDFLAQTRGSCRLRVYRLGTFCRYQAADKERLARFVTHVRETLVRNGVAIPEGTQTVMTRYAPAAAAAPKLEPFVPKRASFAVPSPKAPLPARKREREEQAAAEDEKEVEWDEDEDDSGSSDGSDAVVTPQLLLDIHQDIEALGAVMVEHMKAAVELRYPLWKRAHQEERE